MATTRAETMLYDEKNDGGGGSSSSVSNNKHHHHHRGPGSSPFLSSLPLTNNNQQHRNNNNNIRSGGGSGNAEEKQKQQQQEQQQQLSYLDVGILSTTSAASSSYGDDDFAVAAGPSSSYFHHAEDELLSFFNDDHPFDTRATQSIRQQRYLNPDDSQDNCFYQDGFTFDFDFKTGRRECQFLSSCKLFDGYCEEIDNSDNQPCVTISQLYIFDNTEEDVTTPSGVCQNFTKPYEQSICTIIKEKIEVVNDDDDIYNTSDSSSSSSDDEDVSNKECELYFDNEKCTSCEITSKVPGLATYCIDFDCTNTDLKSTGQTEMNGFAIMPILQSKHVTDKAMCSFDFLSASSNNNNSLPLFHFDDEEPRCPFNIQKVSSKDDKGLDPVYRGLIGLLVGCSVWLLFTILVCIFWKPMPPLSSFKNLLLKPTSKSKSSKNKTKNNKSHHHQQVDDNNIDTENHSTTDEDESNMASVLPVVDAHQL